MTGILFYPTLNNNNNNNKLDTSQINRSSKKKKKKKKFMVHIIIFKWPRIPMSAVILNTDHHYNHDHKTILCKENLIYAQHLICNI